MTTPRRGEIVFAIGLTVVGAALFVQATQIRTLMAQPLGSRDYPLLATGILAILGICVAAQSLWRRMRPQREAIDEPGPAQQPIGDAAGLESAGGAVDPVAPLGLLVLTALYATGLVLVGFYVSTFAFLFLASAVIGWQSKEKRLLRKLALRYLPFALSSVALLYVAVRVLWIYLPDASLLF